MLGQEEDAGRRGAGQGPAVSGTPSFLPGRGWAKGHRGPQGSVGWKVDQPELGWGVRWLGVCAPSVVGSQEGVSTGHGVVQRGSGAASCTGKDMRLGLADEEPSRQRSEPHRLSGVGSWAAELGRQGPGGPALPAWVGQG